jgi:hypothetical protein
MSNAVEELQKLIVLVTTKIIPKINEQEKRINALEKRLQSLESDTVISGPAT